MKVNNKIIVTIADQAIYSGANYLFNIILFRILNIEEYGFFAYTYFIFLFFNFVFSAGVIEPLTVNGVKKRNVEKSLYNYYTIIGLILLVSFFFLVMLLLQTWLFDKISGNKISITLAITLGMLTNFIFITFKRIEYNENNQLASFFSSILYFIILILGSLAGLVFKDQLSGYSITSKTSLIYCLIAFASLIATFFFRHRFLKHFSIIRKTNLRHVYKIWKINFGIGGWMYVTTIFFWLSKYFFSGYLGYTKGFQNTGILKASENLFLPMEQFISALGIIIFPTAVRKGSLAEASSFIKKVSFYLLFAVLMYVMIVVVFFKFISTLLYNKSDWDSGIIYLLCSFGFLTISRVIVDFYAGLRIRLFRMHKVFIIISSVTFLIVFFPGKFLLNNYGLYGFSIVYFSIGVIQILLSLLLSRHLK